MLLTRDEAKLPKISLYQKFDPELSNLYHFFFFNQNLSANIIKDEIIYIYSDRVKFLVLESLDAIYKIEYIETL
jgi:hypothetical protein